MDESEYLKNIPIIDIGALVKNESGGQEKVACEIRKACIEFGFFYVTNHGVDEKLEENLENLSRQFFQQPLEVKNQIAMSKGGRAWRGFFPLGNELTSGKPDMKEGIYFGAELDDDHPLVKLQTPLHGKNLFPDIPGFKETVLEYINVMTKLGHTIMKGIALSLNLEENYFDKYFTDDPLPLFRIFNYPALEQEEIIAKESFGVGEHTDYGVLTILKQDHIGGLEVKVTSQSRWIQAPPIPNSFVCNIGDMLDRMTGGLYRSTPHRVRSPVLLKNEDRVSFPFFFDPNFNARVGLISNLKDVQIIEDPDSRWDHESVHQFDGTYGDYLLNKVSKVFPELKREVL